jgi:hypothetical protein
MELGFSKVESELLSLDDDTWRNRHEQSKWVKSFMDSLPPFLRNDGWLSNLIKTALVEAQISCKAEFERSLETLPLPPSARSYFRRNSGAFQRPVDEVSSIQECDAEISGLQSVETAERSSSMQIDTPTEAAEAELDKALQEKTRQTADLSAAATLAGMAHCSVPNSQTNVFNQPANGSISNENANISLSERQSE